MLPSLLITLSAVPILAGLYRVVQLAGGAEATEGSARFFAEPVAPVLHIFSAIGFLVFGALQVAPRFRRERPDWHRRAGRVVVGSGVVAGLSGLWLTVFFPPYEGDGALLFMFRLVFGSAMIVCTALGFLAIRRRDVARHGAWMLRGYAIGFGATTQFLVHIPWLLFFDRPVGVSRALLLGGAWILNVVAAEWIIRRSPELRARKGSSRTVDEMQPRTYSGSNNLRAAQPR